VWSAGYEADFEQDPTAVAHGKGPYSTPTVAEGRLFTFGVTGVLSVWDAVTGTLLWRKDCSDEPWPDSPFFGAAASPLVRDDLCFVHFGGSEGRRFGAPGRGAMVALRVSDGEERWRWTGDGPAMGASPVLGLIEGRWQLVFKTQERIVAVDPRTGGELWRLPYKVAEDNTISSPLIVSSLLISSDYQKGFAAWRIHPRGESWELRELWRDPRISLSLSSPVVIGDQVVGYSHNRSGHLFGLDLADGSLLWRGEPRWGPYVHVSLFSCGGELVAMRDNGLLVVGTVSRDAFQPLRTYRLGRGKTWAHPAIVDGRIVIRDGDRLVVYRLRSVE
jgi:outer membrane protein assembly factor BamB